jgi:hypothetical protein
MIKTHISSVRNFTSFILTLFIFVAIIPACTKTPTACFTVPVTIHVNVSASFDCTCSKNAGWYELYIDGVDQIGANANGSSSVSLSKTGVLPLTFTTTGNHTVKLITYVNSNKSGKSSQTSQTVMVVQ